MRFLLIGAILVTSLARDVQSAAIDRHLTPETQTLYNVLHSLGRDTNKILVGKQNPTLFGLYGGHSPYWTYEHNGKQEAWMFNPGMAHSNHSDELCDPCALTHDFPAVAGFDFSMIGSDIEDGFVYLVHKAHERGAIITFSYHANNFVTGKHAWISGDNGAFHSIQRILPGGDHYHVFQEKMDIIANFVKTKMVDKNGKLIPIIFRPWHEANGGWFWWGFHNNAQNTADDIKKLHQNTVTYLRDHKGIHNFLYATSPDCGGSIHGEDIYPGNDYVDVIGLDCYLLPHREPSIMQTSVDKIVQRANSNGKVAALTETGVIQEDITQRPHFFTQDLLRSFTAGQGMHLTYMLTWANQRTGNGQYSVYDPYPGHPLAGDYMTFYNDPKTYFLSDLKSAFPQLYH